MGADAIAVGVVATVENSAASPRGADRIGGSRTAGEEYCRQWLRPLASDPKPRPLSGSVQRVLQIARSPLPVRSMLAQPLEPPYTDPYVRWCGRGRRVTAAPMPIVDPNRSFSAPRRLP